MLAGNTWFSLQGLKELKRQDKLWTLPLVVAGIAAVGVMGIIMLWNNYTAIYQLGVMLQKPYLLFLGATLVSVVFLFLSVLPICLSVFFFSRDTRLLVTLPVKPFAICLAKIMEIYFFALPIQALVLIPAFVLYFINGQGSLYFVIAALLNLLLFPFLPLCLVLLLVFCIVKFINIFRYKILFEVLGMLVIVLALLVFQVFLSRSMLAQPLANMDVITALNNQLMRLIALLAPFVWIARGYLPQEFVMLGVSLLLYAGLTAITLLILNRSYIAVYIARCDTALVKQKKSAVLAPVRSMKPLIGLIRKEFMLLFSDSTFIFETAGELLILPLLLIIYSLVIPAAYMSQLLTMIGSMQGLTLIVYAILLAMTAINTVAPTSLSREGRLFVISLLLPVPGRIHVLAKLLVQLILFLSAYWVNLAIIFVNFHLPLLDLIYLIPGGAFFICLTFMLTILPDLKKPYLTWKHPMEAMKQNPNLLFGMGTALLCIGVLIGLGVLLHFLGLAQFLTGLLLTLIIGTAAAFIMPGFLRFADKVYSGGQLY